MPGAVTQAESRDRLTGSPCIFRALRFLKSKCIHLDKDPGCWPARPEPAIWPCAQLTFAIKRQEGGARFCSTSSPSAISPGVVHWPAGCGPASDSARGARAPSGGLLCHRPSAGFPCAWSAPALQRQEDSKSCRAGPRKRRRLSIANKNLVEKPCVPKTDVAGHVSVTNEGV